MSDRPKVSIPVKRAVLIESCHRCAVCGFGLSIELAHIIPWFETQDHRAENLIALCANCHEMADKQKWKKKDSEAYKKNPWALRNGAPQPMSAPQKAMVDFILALDAADMDVSRRVQLVQMVAAYAGVVVADVKLVAVAASNSSLVRIEMPRDAAERIILGFQSEDPRLVSFLDEFALTSPVAQTHDQHASPFGLEGGLKLIETARPTPAEKPPVTNVKEEGLESLIVAAMTNFGWLTGENANYDREYAVDLKQLTAFLETTQEEIAAELQLRMDGPVRRKFLAQLQGEITRRGTIDLMRKGVNHGKHHVDLFYGVPSPENKAAVTRHAANRFSVTRQLRYSREETKRALDLALFINGLPVATFELKNSLTSKQQRTPRSNTSATATRGRLCSPLAGA
jgi:type I restriction enzyme, R subunit